MVRLALTALAISTQLASAAVVLPTVPEVTVTAPKPPEAQQLTGQSGSLIVFVPTAITAGDSAFLRALYRVNMEQSLSLQRSDIQNQMMREFERQARSD
jgi:hypothetical protein